MLITPRPGTDRDTILKNLREVHQRAEDVYNAGHPPYIRLLEYLRWANKAARLLRAQISTASLDALVLTRGHAALLGGISDLSAVIATDVQRTGGIVGDLVDLELTERIGALNDAVQDLAQLLTRWDSRIRYVLPDSSFYIHHPDNVEDADFAELLGLSPSEPFCLLFPMAVIDELDKLKESKDRRVRWRSGFTLAVLQRILSDAGRGTLHPVDTVPLPEIGTFCAETMVEVLFDQPGHVRLPNADDEIIDRALGAHVLAGRHGVTLLTYDTGQATRARTAGLPVRKLASDQGTGDEPEWAAEESRPGTGVRAQRRARTTVRQE
ncbi:PIN domain-containing protein [Actinacidiphila glaucinigra]|uniref:PIN domain-containing protein n=1 Tax=Actinacidiphila glaucinigra TaxID=235986 RepID=UPI002E30753F|nr:PIN domain-containing protein [Actinacidiphila glaucinigra]